MNNKKGMSPSKKKTNQGRRALSKEFFEKRELQHMSNSRRSIKKKERWGKEKED